MVLRQTLAATPFPQGPVGTHSHRKWGSGSGRMHAVSGTCACGQDEWRQAPEGTDKPISHLRLEAAMEGIRPTPSAAQARPGPGPTPLARFHLAVARPI